jgi:hypothetical protein
MKANSFFYRHYFAAGESLSVHAAAVMVGVMMMIAGLVLAATVALLPVGVMVGLLGLFIFGGGVFGHIQRPVRFGDLVDTVLSLAGAAIGMTFTLAVLLFLTAVTVSVVWLSVGWLRNAW